MDFYQKSSDFDLPSQKIVPKGKLEFA